MLSRFKGLWRHPEFLKLWAGQTISQFGSTVTREALPLTAVLTLQATPAQMGLLGATSSLPVLLVGLLAGVWADRVRRRPLMIVADLGRALLLASIPIAALLGGLRIEQLYLVALLAGILSVFFDVAYQAFLPVLVSREHVVEGNSKLGMSDSLSEVLAPALAGGLVQIITAPLTILLDALSFLLSAGSLLLMHSSEPAPTPRAGGSLRAEVVEGVRAIWHHPILRVLVESAAIRSFFGGFFGALYGLYVLRELGMTPAMLGILVATGGIGSLLGAAVAGPAARRYGVGRVLIGALILSALTNLLIPLAHGAGLLALAMLIASQIVGDLGWTVYAINAISLRQTVTPDRLLGRTVASSDFVVGGCAAVGLLVGGGLGGLIGLRPALWLASLGILGGTLWLSLSPIRRAALPAHEREEERALALSA